MISAQLRDAAMVVDLKALKHNIKQQQAALPAGSRILAVVKADAYGHGAVPVAHAAKEAGVDGFCVAMLDEGLELRNAGIDQLMLVLGLTPVHYAPVAALNDISLTVGSVNWLKEYAELAKNESLPPLKVHLALDTGMGRIGFRDVAELKQAWHWLTSQPSFLKDCLRTLPRLTRLTILTLSSSWDAGMSFWLQLIKNRLTFTWPILQSACGIAKRLQPIRFGWGSRCMAAILLVMSCLIRWICSR